MRLRVQHVRLGHWALHFLFDSIPGKHDLSSDPRLFPLRNVAVTPRLDRARAVHARRLSESLIELSFFFLRN